MIRCICVDDEPKALDVIRIHVKQVPQLEVLDYFTDPILAIEFLMHHPIDLIFLDINMPELTGLNLLDKLAQRPLVVFTTAYSEYAVDSYDYQAVDYLLKPIVFNRFLRSVLRAEEQMKNQSKPNGYEDFIFLKDGYKQIKVQIESIDFVQSDGNYLDVHTDQETIITRMNFRDLSRKLPSSFIRIHNSYIVNLAKVERIEGSQICIKETKLSLGPNYRQAVLERLKIK